MSEEFQTKKSDPLPLFPLQTQRMTPLENPLVKFDLRSPDQIKEQVKIAKDVADFFKNHWLWFYVAATVAIYRTVTSTRVNAAIFRIDRALSQKKLSEVKANPRQYESLWREAKMAVKKSKGYKSISQIGKDDRDWGLVQKIYQAKIKKKKK